MIDWKRELTIATYVKATLMDADKEGLWPQSLPEIAASEDQLAAVEAHLRYRLGEQYRSFLAHANGWRAFLQTIDLFGTPELMGGDAMLSALEFLSDSEDVLRLNQCPSQESLLPIAFSAESSDLFVMGGPSSHAPGTIWWLGAELIDTFDCFHDFFLAMVDYNRHLLQDLQHE